MAANQTSPHSRSNDLMNLYKHRVESERVLGFQLGKLEFKTSVLTTGKLYNFN